MLWRYRQQTTSRLVMAILMALGIFQLAEYMICGGLGMTGSGWARLGYICITLLPALGLHLAASLANKKAGLLVGASYASMAGFLAYFVFVPEAAAIQECRPNYAVFELNGVHTLLYAAYYYGWLVTGMVVAWRWSTANKMRRSALRWLVAGYAVFMLPATTVNIIEPTTIAGIPSIMCGFAILLALFLVSKVLPASGVEVIKRQKYRKQQA